MRAARSFIRERVASEYDAVCGEIWELGGRYHPSPGATPEVVYPMAVEIRAQATRMARPEVFASAIRNDVASAGSHTVGNRSSSTHFENLLCDLLSNESQGRIRSTWGTRVAARQRSRDSIKHDRGPLPDLRQ